MKTTKSGSTKRLTKRCKTLLVGTVTALSLLGVGAATASILPNETSRRWQQWVLEQTASPLEYLLGQLGRVDPIFETIMDVAIGEDQTGIESESGEMIDPYKLRTTKPSRGPGLLTQSATVQERDLANLYDQESARAIAAPVLGEQGRDWLEEEVTRTAELVETTHAGASEVQQMAEEAQGLGVTQDVMKQSAEIDAAMSTLIANQTQLTADSHATLLQLHRLQGIQTQIAANTSEGIDEANRRDRLERQIVITGASQSPIFVPGLLDTQTEQTE